MLKITSNFRQVERRWRRLERDYQRGRDAVARGALIDTYRGMKKRLPDWLKSQGVTPNSAARIRKSVRYRFTGKHEIEIYIYNSPVTRLHFGGQHESIQAIPLSPRAHGIRNGRAQWHEVRRIRDLKKGFTFERDGATIIATREPNGEVIEHWRLEDNQTIIKKYNLDDFFTAEANDNLERHIKRRMDAIAKKSRLFF